MTLTPAGGEAVTALEAGDEVVLSVQVELPPGAHTYSQNPGFAGASRISVSELSGIEPVEDAFLPDREPIVAEDPYLGRVEKYTGTVTWSRKYRYTSGVPADLVYASGRLDYQVCDAKRCTMLDHPFESFLEGSLTQPGESSLAAAPADANPADSTLRNAYVLTPQRSSFAGPKADPITVQFELSPTDAQPGDTVSLAITMELQPGWHTFGLIPHATQQSVATSIALDALTNLQPLSDEFQSHEPPEIYEWDFDDVTETIHHGRVTWSRPFKVIEAGPYGAGGEMTYQLCKESCLAPHTVAFSLGSTQDPMHLEQATMAMQSFATPDSGSTAAAAGGATHSESTVQSGSLTNTAGLGWYLVLAFLGGLFLNVMPCVLPVLAIKLLTLVQQAGENRGRLLLLNSCYALGVIGVFLVLATLAATVRLGWGEQFQNQGFVLVMACVFFAMGLSLLGVFEIPIPGMIGSTGGHHQEGPLGAFLTGILATLLATPCSGPFMTSTLAWSVDPSRPASVPFLVFGMMGLGMASPYLLVALDPRLVNWLPKPGMWMVRFKEFAGLAVLGAVIWLLYGMDDEVVVPTLIILLGIGTGLWMIGRLYNHASSPSRKWVVRGLACLTVLSVGWWGYGRYEAGLKLAEENRNARRDLAIALATGGVPAQPHAGTSDPDDDSHELPWQPFSAELLSVLLDQGRTVLIDFTADWCATCKANEAIALNTAATSRFVREHDVVTLVADYTRADEEIKTWLNRFGSTSVPLTVIFPQGNPEAPIILAGPYTEPTLLAHLREAVATDVASRSEQSAALMQPAH